MYRQYAEGDAFGFVMLSNFNIYSSTDVRISLPFSTRHQ